MAKSLRFAGWVGGLVVWFLSIGAGLGVAHGETRVWTGAVNTLWSNAGNWSPAGGIQNGDDLVFPIAGTSTNDVASFQALSLTFMDAHAIGGSALTITGAATGGLIVNGPGTVTINLTLTLGGDQTWPVDDHVVINAPIVLNGHTLTMGGLGVIATTRVPTGSGEIVKIGGASWDSSADPADVPFTGPITVAEGRLWALGPKSLGVEDGTEANGTTVEAGAILHVSGYTTTALNEAIALNNNGYSNSMAFASGVSQRVSGPITLNTYTTITAEPAGYPPSSVIFTSTAAIKGRAISRCTTPRRSFWNRACTRSGASVSADRPMAPCGWARRTRWRRPEASIWRRRRTCR